MTAPAPLGDAADLTADELDMASRLLAGHPFDESQAANWLASKAGPLVAEVRRSRATIEAQAERLAAFETVTRGVCEALERTLPVFGEMESVLVTVGDGEPMAGNVNEARAIAASLRALLPTEAPRACRNYSPWASPVDSDGTEVDPHACMVCGGAKAQHAPTEGVKP